MTLLASEPVKVHKPKTAQFASLLVKKQPRRQAVGVSVFAAEANLQDKGISTAPCAGQGLLNVRKMPNSDDKSGSLTLACPSQTIHLQDSVKKTFEAVTLNDSELDVSTCFDSMSWPEMCKDWVFSFVIKLNLWPVAFWHE